MRGLIRTLTPLGRLALIGLMLLTLAAVGGGLGLRWDPFDFRQKRLEAALTRATRAESDAGARRIEAAGQAEQVGRVEIHHRQTLAVERATVAAVTQARSADDANEPLGAVRADRLRAHDRELCRLAPDLDGCAAASGPG